MHRLTRRRIPSRPVAAVCDRRGPLQSPASLPATAMDDGWLPRRLPNEDEVENSSRTGHIVVLQNGGVLVSTDGLKRRRHVEDGSLASLKTGPKQINADHQDLALAA